jgi:hypothetical protein
MGCLDDQQSRFGWWMDTSSGFIGSPRRQLAIQQIGVENQYSDVLNPETGYEKANSSN